MTRRADVLVVTLKREREREREREKERERKRQKRKKERTSAGQWKKQNTRKKDSFPNPLFFLLLISLNNEGGNAQETPVPPMFGNDVII